MIFSNTQCNIIYDMLYDWLSVHTPGGYRNISVLKHYQKRVWTPIINVINELSNKDKLNEHEYEFINTSTYNGDIFRIQNYNARYKGHIFENANYQSWSRNIEGVSNVTNFSGDVLLIVATANMGIDVFGLLYFLFKHKFITHFNQCKDPKTLLRYEEEQEVTYPVLISAINKVKIIERGNLLEWQTQGLDLPTDKWRRNTLH